MTEEASSSKRIVYVIGTYPDLTKTFIEREIQEARRSGLDLRVVAVQKAARSDVTANSGEVTYLIPTSPRRMISAHVQYLRHDFRKYVATVAYLVTRPHTSAWARVKTLVHFLEGVLAASLVSASKIDHIHAHFADRAAVIAMVMSRLMGVPYSVTAHAFDIYRNPAFLKAKLVEAKFVTTCTAFNQQHLERETGRPIELVYHGLDIGSMPARPRIDGNESMPLVLSVGRLQEKKGFEFLIRACAELRRRGRPLHCDIIGEGPDRERLTSLINQLEIGDMVRMLGALPHSEVMRRYESADLFVLASIVADDGDRDGIPNVILEAMALGIPVVSTSISGIPEVVKPPDTGLLVPPRDSMQLAGAMETLLTDRTMASRAAENAGRMIRERFDIRQNVGRLLQLLLA